MNTAHLRTLEDLSSKIRMQICAYNKTKPEERNDTVFIQEIRKIAHEIENLSDDMEARK